MERRSKASVFCNFETDLNKKTLNTPIKFGTDGWRAIIADDYTVNNVARVAKATAEWLLNQKELNNHVVLGFDCRFAGQLFAETVAKVMLSHNIKLTTWNQFVSTPMISLATKQLGAGLGIILTASHNPPSYNGYKLKAHYGGPLSPEKVQEIEDIIPDLFAFDVSEVSINEFQQSGLYELIDFETRYVEHVRANFDLDAIQNSGLRFAYDAMFGAGQNVIKRILPQTALLHCEHNPSFEGQAPEPIAKNLQPLERFIKERGDIDCALATDGDADRIGLYNGKGEFIDSHHIILLLIHYMVKYKNMNGKVVTAFSATPRVKRMAEHYNLPEQVVKIGFKYIAGIMVDEDVLLGGEESGGIAVKGHIPERDGIWMGLIIWEFMAKSGKSLDDLIQEVYAIVEPFQFERSDLHLTEAQKQRIVATCNSNGYSSFGAYAVQRVETIDGFKFFFDDNRWVMLRASGTEPVLRVYAEAPSMDEVRTILKTTEETILA